MLSMARILSYSNAKCMLLNKLCLCINYVYVYVSISPNEVCGDIMVLAPPPPRPRPPVDPDNTLSQPISFKFYMWVDMVNNHINT